MSFIKAFFTVATEFVCFICHLDSCGVNDLNDNVMLIIMKPPSPTKRNSNPNTFFLIGLHYSFENDKFHPNAPWCWTFTPEIAGM